MTNAETIASVLKGIATLAHALDAAGLQDFKTATNNLIAQLTPVLPTKDDGSVYSDDELHAAADAARQPFLDAKAITGQA